MELASLANTQFDCVFGPIAGEPPVLTADQQSAVDILTSDAAVVAFMTPILEPYVSPNVLVNSETLVWLETRKGHLIKPDLFSVPKWAYTKRTHNNSGVAYDMNRRFGTIDDIRLYDVAQIANCMCSVTDSALGETIERMRCLTFFTRSDQAPVTSGIVFGKRSFSLLRVQRDRLTFRQVGSWTDPGSAKLVKDFLAPTSPWSAEALLRDSDWRVADPHVIPDLSTAFLGAGTYGRVIRVISAAAAAAVVADDQYAALKMVPNVYLDQVLDELDALNKHKDNCDCSLVCRPVTGLLQSPTMCGFVHSPVGLCCLSRELIAQNKSLLRLIGLCMYNLHNHDPPMCHGDARIQNLVYSWDKSYLFWVDLRTSRIIPAYLNNIRRHLDLETLTNSIVDNISTLPEVADAIDRYSLDPSQAVMDEIMEVVLRSVV